MALPKLNDVPKYELTIPSTGKEVTFRPFLVKEQKVLLIAMESQDEKQILNAIIDTIDACVYDKINIYNLANFDLEYMFLKIRSVSAGETSKVNLRCVDCEELTEVTIPLDKIKIDINPKEKEIALNDQYTLEMKYPGFNASLLDIDDEDEGTLTKAIFKLIFMCLENLKTEEEIISFKDQPEEEIEQFLESLTSAQFDKIMNFINNLPRLKHEVSFDCSNCNTSNTLTLQGIQDFFS